MPSEFDRERLPDLLIDPREALNLEIKNWLDLAASNEAKATLAKAIIALANHGGGFIILGFAESENCYQEDAGRPDTLESYNQDAINGIVQSYCDPSFHCHVQNVPNSDGVLFPIIVVPGGHKVPIRAQRGGPNGHALQHNGIYMRKPGPRSEEPRDSRDWDELLSKCMQNRRDEMLDQIRDIVRGSTTLDNATPAENIEQQPALSEWIEDGYEHWRSITSDLPEYAEQRMPFGHYCIAYQLRGQHREITPTEFSEIVRQSEVRHTGWPPFWYPTTQELAPYMLDNAIQCWLGAESTSFFGGIDAAHSDFWRIHPTGRAFLLRGYQEDGVDAQTPAGRQVQPGTVFDINLPIWRIGETLLHANQLSSLLFDGPTTIEFVATYKGLSGRTLTSIDNRRLMRGNRVARQDKITVRTSVETQAIDSNLPEIVHPLISPLYALFDFFELSTVLVTDELNRLRSSRH